MHLCGVFMKISNESNNKKEESIYNYMVYVFHNSLEMFILGWGVLDSKYLKKNIPQSAYVLVCVLVINILSFQSQILDRWDKL